MLEYNSKNEIMLLTCDECDCEETYDGPWDDCYDDALMEGWGFIKHPVDGELLHYCADCESYV